VKLVVDPPVGYDRKTLVAALRLSHPLRQFSHGFPRIYTDFTLGPLMLSVSIRVHPWRKIFFSHARIDIELRPIL
jgi:hypothetical protein